MEKRVEELEKKVKFLREDIDLLYRAFEPILRPLMKAGRKRTKKSKFSTWRMK